MRVSSWRPPLHWTGTIFRWLLVAAATILGRAKSSPGSRTPSASQKKNRSLTPLTRLQREKKFFERIDLLKRATHGDRTMRAMATPMYGSSYLGQGWKDNRINQVRHYQAWVYVAIKIIATLIAQQQPMLSHVVAAERDRRNKHYSYRFVNGRLRQKALGHTIKPHEDLEPLDDDHPLVRLLQFPNDYDTAWDIWYETILFLLLTGNSYWWMPENAWGEPAEIWVLPAHWVWPIAGKDTMVEIYEIRPIAGTAGVWHIPAREVINFRYKSPISKVDGYSPLTAGSRWVDQSDSVDEARRASMKNGAMPGVALELPAEMADPTQQDIERIEQKFVSKFAGENKYGKPIILSPGLKMTPLTISPKEMDFHATADQVRDYVLALFHISKAVCGITDEVNYASMIAAQDGVSRFAINPLLSMIDQTLTRHLASRFRNGDRLRIWHLDTAPEDPAQKLAENTAYLDRGVLTINEVRQDLGRESYQHGGDDPFMDASKMPMPLHSGDDLDLSAIAEAAGTMRQAEQGPPPGQPGAESPETGDEMASAPTPALASALNGNGATMPKALRSRLTSGLDWSAVKKIVHEENHNLNGRLLNGSRQ